MDALYALQLDLQKQINNSYINFKKTGVAKMNRITAQTRLAGLEDCCARFKTNHNKIISSKDVPLDHVYFTSNLNEQVIDSFYDRKGEFLQFIENLRLAEQEREQTVQVPNQTGNANVTINASTIEAQGLLKLNLPKFTGKFSDWDNFRDLFRSVVHRRANLDPSIKYFHLRPNLGGEALELVKSIPVSGDQYEAAWNTLVAYYDNKRRTVNTLVALLLSVKPMKVESASELKRISREFFSPLESIRKLGRSDSDIANDLLVYLSVELFDASSKKEWKKTIDKSNDTPPTIEQLKEFIQGQIENLDDGKESQSSSNNNSAKGQAFKGKQTNSESKNTVHSFETLSSETRFKSLSCVLCNADHNLYKCDQFLGKSVADRREFAKNKQLCFNCLSRRHSKDPCKSRYNCFTCKARHHTLLHLANPESQSENNVNNPPSNQSVSNRALQNSNCTNTVATNTTSDVGEVMNGTGVLLATALICVTGPKGKQLTVKALIDPCSQVSLVTRNLCNQLALIQEETHVCVQGVGKGESQVANKLALLKLAHHFKSNFLLETKALVLPKLSSYKPPVVQMSPLAYLRDLELADPNYLEYMNIELLLGASVYADIIEERIVRGTAHQPIAVSSKFGWILTGECSGVKKAPEQQVLTVSVLHCAFEKEQNTELLELVREFWRTEEINTAKNPRSVQEQYWEDLFAETTYRDGAGRYVVRLPWKDERYANKVKLSDSLPHAMSALKRLEANFQKDKRLELEYKNFMREYLNLGHMKLIESTAPLPSFNRFFLPHHGVRKENSSTTKLRTVFNGSSRIRTGESLNDLLHRGPNLLMNPIDLICSLRSYKIALSADVEKNVPTNSSAETR